MADTAPYCFLLRGSILFVMVLLSRTGHSSRADSARTDIEPSRVSRIQEAACWAHVRRKFFDLQQAHASPVASEALERIAALYAIEKEIRGWSAEERKQVRNARARPLLESLRQWFEATLPKLSRKSDTTAAIRYALSRWDAVLRYSNDGNIEIDNNAAERVLRAVALGRKNYLFAGSDVGGDR